MAESSEDLSPPPQFQLNRSDVVWITTALIALAIVLILAFLNWSGVERASMKAIAARDDVGLLRTVLRLLDDAETGQRGYLLTGEARYLDPYYNARSQLA